MAVCPVMSDRDGNVFCTEQLDAMEHQLENIQDALLDTRSKED